MFCCHRNSVTASDWSRFRHFKILLKISILGYLSILDWMAGVLKGLVAMVMSSGFWLVKVWILSYLVANTKLTPFDLAANTKLTPFVWATYVSVHWYKLFLVIIIILPLLLLNMNLSDQFLSYYQSKPDETSHGHCWACAEVHSTVVSKKYYHVTEWWPLIGPNLDIAGFCWKLVYRGI